MILQLADIQSPRALLRLCLDIARRIAYPDLDVSAALDTFERMAVPLRDPIWRVGPAPTVGDIESLSDYFNERLHFRPNTSRYYEPENSFLNMVLARRTGIPISLSIVYMALAEETGLPLQGVSAPAHFLCRCDLAHGPVFVDPFNGGRTMTEAQALRFLQNVARPSELTRDALRPARTEDIVRRLLSNLKPIYLRRRKHELAERVLHVATDLMPEEPRHWIERGAVLAAMGRRRAAADVATRAAAMDVGGEAMTQRQHLLAALHEQLAPVN